MRDNVPPRTFFAAVPALSSIILRIVWLCYHPWLLDRVVYYKQQWTSIYCGCKKSKTRARERESVIKSQSRGLACIICLNLQSWSIVSAAGLGTRHTRCMKTCLLESENDLTWNAWLRLIKWIHIIAQIQRSGLSSFGQWALLSRICGFCSFPDMVLQAMMGVCKCLCNQGWRTIMQIKH